MFSMILSDKFSRESFLKDLGEYIKKRSGKRKTCFGCSKLKKLLAAAKLSSQFLLFEGERSLTISSDDCITSDDFSDAISEGRLSKILEKHGISILKSTKETQEGVKPTFDINDLEELSKRKKVIRPQAEEKKPKATEPKKTQAPSPTKKSTKSTFFDSKPKPAIEQTTTPAKKTTGLVQTGIKKFEALAAAGRK